PPAPPGPPSPAAKFYQAKAGFANYYFNKQEQDRLLAAFRKHGDFAGLTGPWQLEGTALVKKSLQTFKYAIKPEKEKDSKDTRIVLNMDVGVIPYKVEPLKKGQEVRDLKEPPGSGGLAVALYHYWQFLTLGPKGFEGEFYHGGQEPFYPP